MTSEENKSRINYSWGQFILDMLRPLTYVTGVLSLSGGSGVYFANMFGLINADKEPTKFLITGMALLVAAAIFQTEKNSRPTN